MRPAIYEAERYASGAADSRSEARAEAIGGRLQAVVRPRTGAWGGLSIDYWYLFFPLDNRKVRRIVV